MRADRYFFARFYVIHGVSAGTLYHATTFRVQAGLKTSWSVSGGRVYGLSLNIIIAPLVEDNE